VQVITLNLGVVSCMLFTVSYAGELLSEIADLPVHHITKQTFAVII
jgi:hypothetical protein